MTVPSTRAVRAEPGRASTGPPPSGSSGGRRYERSRPSYPAAAVDLVVEVLGAAPGPPGARPGRRHRQVHPPARALGRRAWWPSSRWRPCARSCRSRRPEVDRARRHRRGHPPGRRQRRRGGGGPGLPLVRRPRGAGRDPPGAARPGSARPGLERARRVGRLGAPASGTSWWPPPGSKPYEASIDWAAVVAGAGGFGPLHHSRFPYGQEITADLLVRAGRLDELRVRPRRRRPSCLPGRRWPTWPAPTPTWPGGDPFTFPYFTDVFWCERT